MLGPLFLFAAVFSMDSVNAGHLADQSPFLPSTPGARQQNGALAADHVELRGIMTGPSGNLFYLFDPARKSGRWIGADDTEEVFSIVAWDADTESLELRSSGGELSHLRMHASKTLTAGLASEPAVANSTSAADGNPAAAETHAEVQKAWREEFQRRQAENAASN